VARKFPSKKTTRPCRHFGFPGYERAAGFQWSSGTSRGGKTFWKKTRRVRLLRGGREVGSAPSTRVCLRRIVLQTKFVTVNAGHP